MRSYFHSYHEDNVYSLYNFIDRREIGKFGSHCLSIHNLMSPEFMKFALRGCYPRRKWQCLIF